MGIINGTFDVSLEGWQSNEKVYLENGYAKFNQCGPVRAYMLQRFVIDSPILSFDWATQNNLCCPPGCIGYPAFIFELIIHDIVNGTPIDTTVISEWFPAGIYLQGGRIIKDISQYLGKDATLQFRDAAYDGYCKVDIMVNTVKTDKDEIILARNKIKKCKKIDDKEKQIDCIYEMLYDITKAQDITNLTIREIVNNSEDPRWIPIHITDNANAIILGISEHKGNPKSIVRRGGYVEEKVNSLSDKWSMLKWKYDDNK